MQGAGPTLAWKLPALIFWLLLELVLACAGADEGRAEFPCLSKTVAGTQFDYMVKRGDSYRLVSARFGVDPRVIAAANNRLLSSKLYPGETLHIDNRHIAPCGLEKGILINVAQRMLFLYRDGKLEGAYPVAVGRATWRTPTGSFKVLELREHPVWRVPESIREEQALEGKAVQETVPPGPGNPLGDYWIGLSIPALGIHATNAPASIYTYSTHGCIRLHPDDAKHLFDRVSVGELGLIIYEPALFARLGDGRVFLEVNRDIYRRKGAEPADVRKLADFAGLTNLIDWPRAIQVVNGREGIARDVSVRGPTGEIFRRDK